MSVSLPFVLSHKRILYVAAVIRKANWQRTCITWCHPICKWNIDDPRLHKETILTGAHCMNDFSIVIQIRRKFYSAVIPFTVSDRYDFLHGTTAGLSRHLQNFVALWYHIIELPIFYGIWITMEKSFEKWTTVISINFTVNWKDNHRLW